MEAYQLQDGESEKPFNNDHEANRMPDMVAPNHQGPIEFSPYSANTHHVLRGPSTMQYVFHGLWFFLTNPGTMWQHVLLPLCCFMLISFTGLILMFVFTMAPQADWFEGIGVPHWLSWIVAFLFVVIEVILLSFVTCQLLFGYAQDKLFEETLKKKGVDMDAMEGSTFRRSITTQLWHILVQVIVMALTIWLNIGPIIGTLLFCWINGFFLAWDMEQSYFEARGIGFSGQVRYVMSRSMDYFWFGVAAELLLLIPFVGVLALFTNYVASALWVADRENCKEIPRK